MLAYPFVYNGRTFLPGGEVPALTSQRLNCGHDAVPEGSCPGWYIDDYGYTWCQACAHQIETAEFAQADAYTAYLGPHLITTGAGTILAIITSERKSEHYTPTGGWYMRYDVRATAGDGSRWYGRSSNGTCLITLHRAKGQLWV